jgi:DNA polymerase-3 subunit beta
MKITITREHLLDPIVLVDKMSGKNLSQPVLQCVLLETTQESLVLKATNLEVGVEATVPATVVTQGKVAVFGSVLVGLLQTLPSGATVTLSKQDGVLVVEGPTSTSKIATHDVEEFPELPQAQSSTPITIAARQLKEALNSVSFCTSSSTIKPELAAVYTHFNGSELVTAATDSFRLAEKRTPLIKATSCEPVLIPSRSVADVVRVLDRVKGDVTCGVSEHLLTLEAPGLTLSTRLVQGSFPDYTQIIPKQFSTEATTLRFDIEQVLRKAAIFTDQFNKTSLHVDAKENTITIHTESKQVGENTDTVTASVTGTGCEISFNQRYLNDAFTTIASDSVLLSFVGESQPVVIRPLGDESYRYLVMPMNK